MRPSEPWQFGWTEALSGVSMCIRIHILSDVYIYSSLGVPSVTCIVGQKKRYRGSVGVGGCWEFRTPSCLSDMLILG